MHSSQGVGSHDGQGLKKIFLMILVRGFIVPCFTWETTGVKNPTGKKVCLGGYSCILTIRVCAAVQGMVYLTPGRPATKIFLLTWMASRGINLGTTGLWVSTLKHSTTLHVPSIALLIILNLQRFIDIPSANSMNASLDRRNVCA